MSTLSTNNLVKLSKTLTVHGFMNRLNGAKPFYKKDNVCKYYTVEGDVLTVYEKETNSFYEYTITINTLTVLYSCYDDRRYMEE